MPKLDCPENHLTRHRLTRFAPVPDAISRPAVRHVMACVDTSTFARAVLAHAAAVAEAMNSRLTIMRVLEPPTGRHAPTDPVEWDLRHHEAMAEVERLVSDTDRSIRTEAIVVEGSAADQICAWAHEHNVDLTVLGTCGETSSSECGLGGTARRVAESVRGSVLLVPTTEVGEGAIRYHRVMVPLDCSSRAECALPIAVSIAVAHDADLVLFHATPEVALTEVGPLEAEDLELRDRLQRRNAGIAQQYLNKMQARLSLNGGTTRARLLSGGDPRHAIARATSDEKIDFIVLSAAGFSGHSDLSVGSVADYLMSHMTTPILLVRGQAPHPQLRRRNSVAASVLRLPSRILS